MRRRTPEGNRCTEWLALLTGRRAPGRERRRAGRRRPAADGFGAAGRPGCLSVRDPVGSASQPAGGVPGCSGPAGSPGRARGVLAPEDPAAPTALATRAGHRLESDDRRSSGAKPRCRHHGQCHGRNKGDRDRPGPVTERVGQQQDADEGEGHPCEGTAPHGPHRPEVTAGDSARTGRPPPLARPDDRRAMHRSGATNGSSRSVRTRAPSLPSTPFISPR